MVTCLWIYEYDNVDRDHKYEKERQKLIKDHGNTAIRTNPDSADFNIDRLIGQIYMHFNESTKNKLKNQLKNYWLMIFQKDC